MQVSFENNRFDLVLNGKRFYFSPASVSFWESERVLEIDCFKILPKKDIVKAIAEKEGFKFTYTFTADGDFLKISLAIENGDDNIALKSVNVVNALTAPCFENYPVIYMSADNMIGVEGLRSFDRNRRGSTYTALTDRYGNGAFLMGFTDSRREIHWIDTFFETKSFTAVAMRDGVTLKSGDTLTLAPLVIGFDNSLNKLLSEYGDKIGRDSEAIIPSEIATGWCSFYYYYSFEDEKEIIGAAEMLKKSAIANDVKYILYDDGWENREKGPMHNWGDWECVPERCPSGMKGMVDKIHALGYKTGLWLAPFTVSKNSNLFKEHPDWALTTEETITLGAADYGLDLSNPEVTEFIRNTFERVFNEWGYDYIKIDFIGMALFEGKHHSREKTLAAYYHDTLKMIKEIAGDRHVLTCGPAIFQTVGATDSIRIGPDVGNRWVIPTDWADQIGGNCSIKPCINNTVRRSWMHNRLFHIDPDCMMARHFENPFERILYGGESIFGVPFSKEILGIDDVAFDSWSKLIWFFSLPNFLGEVWDELLPSRQARIKESFDFPMRKIGYVDYYADPEIAVFKTEDDSEDKPQMLAVWNYSDKAANIMLPAEITGGLEWRYEEMLGDGVIEGKGGIFAFPEIAPHAAKIFKKVK
ncbi:MAG: alpha-galactosidase [Clostridia bacterium]|nr:alpha-galactosidase [Clostridia bacterium]